MNPIAEDILMHYGTRRRSGRYPWGSGDNPFQRSGDFLSRIEDLRKDKAVYVDDKGKVWTGDTAIAKILGLTTTQFRVQESLANAERRSILVDKARGLRDKGYSLNEIAKEMGYKNDSSVRSLLNKDAEHRMKASMNAAMRLKEEVDRKGMIDVGAGVEREVGISPERMKQALYILELEGYPTYGGGVPQVTNKGQQSNRKVLCVPGTEHKEIYNYEKVHTFKDYVSKDGGETFEPKWVYPKSLDINRVMVRYAEDGGTERDGLVELRRNVDDISLGNSRYSQVRILVDNDKYIKGMAAYSDDIPDGYDVIFNTNKPKSVEKRNVFKNIESDPDNPFGSLIKPGIYDPTNPVSDPKVGQSYYIDKNGNKQLSVINKRSDEGDWHSWSKNLPSQFLSKQNMTLINKQLNLAMADKKDEYEQIKNLTNPTVKKVLLKSFADDCDAAAVSLHAAALPRQKYQVIMPVPTMKDNEVYAPNYKNGEKVALVRFPHGGTFEIPILTVNNKHKDSEKLIGKNPLDAIAINSKVAERLSGADFDGDTVMVIPTGNKIKITSEPPLKALERFDPKLEYGYHEMVKDSKGKNHYYRNGIEFKPMRNTQTEMGIASNLITDMTLLGADQHELAKAVKHSMVVIDAEKHGLDYKQSERDNDIKALKKKYQGRIENGKYREGAATIISRAKSQETVPKRKGSPKPNIKGKKWYDPNKPEGSIVYTEVKEEYKIFKTVKDDITGKKVINPETGKPLKIDTGKTAIRTQRSTKMRETDDAYTLISKMARPEEKAYAEYANSLKALANTARIEMSNTGKIEYNKNANLKYKKEVDHLISQLNVSLKNAPRERHANNIANAVINAKYTDNPDMTNEEKKKLSQQELTRARALVGAERTPVRVNDREWEAIQAGAISETTLYKIINNINIDELRARATPRQQLGLTQAQINRIKAYKSSGYTNEEIAERLGVSASTVINHLK